MNLDNMNVSLGLIVKVAVPGLMAFGTILTAWIGFQNHLEDEKKIVQRIKVIECVMGIKTQWECFPSAPQPFGIQPEASSFDPSLFLDSVDEAVEEGD